jgi:two-component system response regulator NreC
MIKTLIVDDNCLFRERLKAFLAEYPEIEVVDEAGEGSSALSKARELKPQLVLMDIKMRGINGLSVTAQLKRELPEIQVIILSLLDLEAYREAAQAVGASAYVVKKDLADKLMPVIWRVTQTDQPL